VALATVNATQLAHLPPPPLDAVALGDYRWRVTPRLRRVGFGSAAALVLAGVLCAVLVPGLAGEILTLTLIAAGLAGALLLVFLEIGYGEERDLARDEDRRRKRRLRLLSLRRGSRARPPRRPG
jgi:hypothetical protein